MPIDWVPKNTPNALGFNTGVDWNTVAQNWDNIPDEQKRDYLLKFGYLYGSLPNRLLIAPIFGSLSGYRNYNAFLPLYQQYAMAGLPKQVGVGNEYGQYKYFSNAPDLGMLLPVALAMYGANAGWFGKAAPAAGGYSTAGTINPAWASSAGMGASSLGAAPIGAGAAASGLGGSMFTPLGVGGLGLGYSGVGYGGLGGMALGGGAGTLAAGAGLSGLMGAATRSTTATRGLWGTLGKVASGVSKYVVPALNAYSVWQSVKGANKSMSSAQNAIKGMNALAGINLSNLAGQMSGKRAQMMTARGFPTSSEMVSWSPGFYQWLIQEQARQQAAAAQPALEYYSNLAQQYNQAAGNAMTALLTWYMNKGKPTPQTPQPTSSNVIQIFPDAFDIAKYGLLAGKP